MVQTLMREIFSFSTMNEAWQKFAWFWSVLFFGLWGYWTYSELASPSTTGIPYRTFIILVGTLSAFALFAWFLNYNSKRRYTLIQQAESRVALIVFQLVLLIWFLQLFIAPNVVWALSGLLAIVYTYLPLRSAIAYILEMFALGGMGTSNVIGYGPFMPWETLASMAFFLSFAIVTILFAIWISRVVEQSHERRMLLEELQATQAELAKVEHEKGILTERQRLAHEIHDTLAQGFTSIIMEMEAAEGATKLVDKDPAPHIVRARNTARRNLEQVRHVLQDLRGATLIDRSLEQVLRQEVEAWGNQNGILAGFKITGTLAELPKDHEHVLIRIAQESLANVRKHAGAAEVSVTLSYLDDCVILDVQDNGVGFNHEDGESKKSELSGGMGVHTMRERAANLGGTLAIESDFKQGTTVVVQLPI